MSVTNMDATGCVFAKVVVVDGSYNGEIGVGARLGAIKARG